MMRWNGARASVISAVTDPVRHLYVHIPFCTRICPFCAFYKEQAALADKERFVDALVLEAQRTSVEFPFALETIYFGGGTPSALTTAQLERIGGALREHFDFGGVREWTLEANPGTVSQTKAALLRSLGITRISLGVQSWDDGLLQLLGREHDSAEAERSFHILRSAGLANISIDLMFALPGQTERQWRDSLARTIALGPEHISTYCLTYEEDTEFLARFTSGEFRRDENDEADFFGIATELLEGAGYEQYEISNYARPSFRSLHNQAYWAGEDYVSLGPGAFSTRGMKRWQSVPDHREYARRIFAGESPNTDVETLTPNAKRTERIALALRTSDGLHLQHVHGDYAHLEAEGLITRNDDCIVLTRAGRAVADAIAAELL